MNHIQELSALQQQIGYKANMGNVSLVALLGLCGEAGEVAGETNVMQDDRLGDCMTDYVNIAEVVDDQKKRLRYYDINAFVTVTEAIDLELADQLYYLNILAMNRGLTLNDLARMSVEKVHRKMETIGHEFQQEKRN